MDTRVYKTGQTGRILFRHENPTSDRPCPNPSFPFSTPTYKGDRLASIYSEYHGYPEYVKIGCLFFATGTPQRSRGGPSTQYAAPADDREIT